MLDTVRIVERFSLKMDISLVIMAAGMGSRYDSPDANGQRKIKQLELVGPNGEIIMDYSIHDAIKAGFNKIIFVIRHDIEKNFREVIGDRIEKICANHGVKVAYAYQELDDLPAGFSPVEDRTKPWGTGQAILVTKNIIDGPFAVINADDYYGKTAYKKVYDFLKNYDKKEPNKLCMAGFVLKNTLSDNGGVTRGICKMKDGYLTNVVETKNIVKVVSTEGSISAKVEDKEVDVDSLVSMNFWGFTPEFVSTLETGFIDFLNNTNDKTKDEYLLPIYVGELVTDEKITVEVLDTPDTWFGVTYKEDKDYVVQSFNELISKGEYSGTDLFSDI